MASTTNSSRPLKRWVAELSLPVEVVTLSV
jgi:hypothetical protein